MHAQSLSHPLSFIRVCQNLAHPIESPSQIVTQSSQNMVSSQDIKKPVPGDSVRSTTSPWFLPTVAVMLFIQAFLAVDCARQWTPTHDEYWHLPIGLRMWSGHRWDDDVINPPLVRLWSAIPLRLAGATTGEPAYRADRPDGRPDVGDIGDAFWDANQNVRTWFLLGRLMIVPMATFMGVIIVVWARHWFGERSAILSLLLFVCCPTTLANSAIVTHDLPLAAAWLATLFFFTRFAESTTWQTAIAFGLSLGIALLCKLTAVILVPLSIILWFVIRLPESQPMKTSTGSIRNIILTWGLSFLVAIFVVNAGYLFRGVCIPLNSLTFSSGRLSQLQSQFNPIGNIPVPIARDYVAAVDRLMLDLERQHPVYLDGEWSDHPFALYYAKALIYKLPISTLILSVIAIGVLIWPTPNANDRRRAVFLLISGSILPILASRSANQIGIRYILPSLPLICIFAGQSARWMTDRDKLGAFFSKCLRVAKRREVPHPQTNKVFNNTSEARKTMDVHPGSRLIYMTCWLAAVTAPLALRFHPDHLAFFNAIAGGPPQGRWHLVDSNIDWGQDLHHLKEQLDKRKIELDGLAYYGTVIPSRLGLRAPAPPSRFPRPGWYAVSANFVQGRPHVLRDIDGNRTAVGIDEFGYFRFFQPKLRVGYSIEVYQLTDQDVARYEFELRRQNSISL